MGARFDAGLALRSAWALARSRDRERLARSPFAPMARLLPLSFAAAFGADEPPRRLHALANRYVDHLALNRLDHAELLRGARCQEVRGAAALEPLRRAGTGAVVCSLHFGPFYFVPVELAWLGWQVQALMIGQLHEELAPRFLELAARGGLNFEPLAARSVRSVVGALRGLGEGRALVVYADGQNTAGTGRAAAGHDLAVDVLGMPLRIIAGPAWLAARARVPLVPALARREGLGRRVLEFGPPVPPPADDSREAMERATREVFAWFEPRVRAHPEQWGAWINPYAMWREAGRSPSVGADQYRAALARIGAGLESGRGRLRAEPAHVAVVRGERHRILHGPTRRALDADPLTCDLLEAALRGTTLAELARGSRAPREALAEGIARLTLAGLAQLDER